MGLSPEVDSDLRRVSRQLKSDPQHIALGYVLDEYLSLLGDFPRAQYFLDKDEAVHLYKYHEIGAHSGLCLALADEKRVAKILVREGLTFLKQRLEIEGAEFFGIDCFESVVMAATVLDDTELIAEVLDFAKNYRGLFPEDQRQKPISSSDQDEYKQSSKPFLGKEGLRFGVVRLIQNSRLEQASQLLDSGFDLIERAETLYIALDYFAVSGSMPVRSLLISQTLKVLAELEPLANLNDDDAEVSLPHLSKKLAVFQARSGLRQDAMETIGSYSGYFDGVGMTLACRAQVLLSLPEAAITEHERAKELSSVVSSLKRIAAKADQSASDEIEDFAHEVATEGALASEYGVQALDLVPNGEDQEWDWIRVACAVLLHPDQKLKKRVITKAVKAIPILAQNGDDLEKDRMSDLAQVCDRAFDTIACLAVKQPAEQLLRPMLDELEKLGNAKGIRIIASDLSNAALKCDCLELAIRARAFAQSVYYKEGTSSLEEGEWLISLAERYAKRGEREKAEEYLRQTQEIGAQLLMSSSMDSLLTRLSEELPEKQSSSSGGLGLSLTHKDKLLIHLQSLACVGIKYGFTEIGAQALSDLKTQLTQKKEDPKQALSARLDFARSLASYVLEIYISPKEDEIRYGTELL